MIWPVDCFGGGGVGGSACKVAVRIYCTVFLFLGGSTLSFPLSLFSPLVPLEALRLRWRREPPYEAPLAFAFVARSPSLLHCLSLAISVIPLGILSGCVAKGNISPLPLIVVVVISPGS